MKTNVLGYPRIGEKRELKKANEAFWEGNLTEEELLAVAENIRVHNWTLQKEAGIDLIPSNDFSVYDQVLDLSFTLNVIPERFAPTKSLSELKQYFAIARGYQKDGIDVTASEMTKWFDTNYHYIVPEFTKDQSFSIKVNKPLNEYNLAKKHGFETKPVLLGLVTYLLVGKEKEAGFHRLDLADRLLPVYIQIIQSLVDAGAKTIQIDEPYLVLDLPQGAARAARTGETGRLAVQVVLALVDDQAPAQDVLRAITQRQLRLRQHQVHLGHAIGTGMDVAQIAGMVVIIMPCRIAVLLARQMEMATRAGGIRRAAIAFLMHVEAMVAVGLQAGHVALDANLVTLMHETDRALGRRADGGLQIRHGFCGTLRAFGRSRSAVLVIMGAMLMGTGRDRQRGQHGQGHPLDRECHLGFS